MTIGIVYLVLSYVLMALLIRWANRQRVFLDNDDKLAAGVIFLMSPCMLPVIACLALCYWTTVLVKFILGF